MEIFRPLIVAVLVALASFPLRIVFSETAFMWAMGVAAFLAALLANWLVRSSRRPKQ